MMADGVQELTERQKEILRLLLDGYDAKSAASQLGISVHTVNEHLREARRQLGVTSSREAARALREAETGIPNNLRSKSFGVIQPRGGRYWLAPASPKLRAAYAGVALMMLVAAAVVGLSLAKGGAASDAADTPPRVLASNPASEATIPPGPFLLTLTFDRPMLDGDYSFVQISPETFPRCEPRPQLSSNARTFTLRCTAQAGRNYEVWFNRPPYMNFKSLSGTPAQPHQLRFRVKAR